MAMTRAENSSDTSESSLRQLSDFSLVAGGPLYQLLRRTRLSGDALELTRRRVVVTVLITWLPLLLLSIVEGNAWPRSGAMAFLQDFETHLRFLIAAPLLIWAEVRVHRVLPGIVRCFVERGLISGAVRPTFDAAIASAMRLRNSVVAELVLIAFVYSVGVPFVWRDQLALDVTSWYATLNGGQLQPSLAGWWVGLVSLPLFQFLTLRWFFRLSIWARFLLQVARMPLNLEPMHPDGTAGLQFLARTGRAYMFVPLALGTVLSGTVANRIFHDGATLLEFKVEIVGMVACLVALILAPLIVFQPQLRAAQRKGLTEMGALGQRYAREFRQKWMQGLRDPEDPLLGSADIQSLADLRTASMWSREYGSSRSR